MSIKQNFKMGLAMIVLVLIFSFKFALAETPGLSDFSSSGTCIAPNHAEGSLVSGLGNVIDNIVGIVSDFIFGQRKDAAGFFEEKFWTTTPDFGTREWDNGIVKKMFMSLTTDARFQVVFYLSVVLLVSYIGFSFAIGTSSISATELTQQFIKIAIIVFFITPAGWDTYLNLIVKNVLDASRYFNRAIIASMYNVPLSNITSPFQPIDMVLGIILHADTWKKILALMWASGFLFTALLLIVLGFVMVTCGIILLKAAVLYATTIIVAGVLLSVGPIFMICLLFERTRDYFNKWLKNLIGIFMQQYMLFLGFFLFCVIITGMIQGLFFFEACVGPVVMLKLMIKMPQFINDIINGIFMIVNAVLFFVSIPTPKLPEYIVNVSITIIESFKPVTPTFDLPTNIFSAGSLFIVTMMFSKFIDGVVSLGADIAEAGTDASQVAPQGIMGALSKAQGAATSGAASALKNVATGQAVVGAVHLAEKGKNYLNAAAKAREISGKTKFDKSKGVGHNMGVALTKAMKGTAKALSVPASLSNIAQSKETVARNRAIESNQVIRQNVIDSEVKNMIKSGTIQNASQLTDDDKTAINAKADAKLKQVGHSGVFVNGKELGMSELKDGGETIIEETKTLTIKKEGIKLGASQDFKNQTLVDKIQSAATNTVKRGLLKTSIGNTGRKGEHW